MALVYNWPATFADGYYAQVMEGGMELICGNTFGSHVDWRQWRVPPRVRPLGEGRNWRWLDEDARTITMTRPIDDERAIRFAGHVDGGFTDTFEDERLVAANVFDTDSAGHWLSYLTGPAHAPLRRIVVNGTEWPGITGRAGGVAASFGEFCTTLDYATFATYNIASGELVRTHRPTGTFNEFTFYRGWIGHGYFGDAHVVSPFGGQWTANAYQDSREGVPVITFGPGGVPWCVTSIEHPDGTMGVLLRPVGELECIEIVGPRFAGLSAAYAPDLKRFTVAGWGDTGGLTLLWVDALAQRKIVAPAISTLPRPVFVGPFWKTNIRYGDRVPDYPMNVEVITEPEAVPRSPVDVIVDPGAFTGITDTSRVRGIYVAAEEDGGNVAMDDACVAARGAWRALMPDVEVPPVVAYITPGMRARPGWPPKEPDVYGPQLYFDAPPSFHLLDAMMAEWEASLPTDRQWLLVAQAYDRVQYREWMPALASVSPHYLELVRVRPWVEGILWFSVNRTGGVADYPVLLQAHRKIFQAVPGAPARLRKRQQPQPGGDVIKVHMGTRPGVDFADRGKVGEPAFVDFRVESDSAVTEIRIDRRRDGKPGLVLKPGAEQPDLRDLRGVKVVMRAAGNQSWHVGAKNAAGESDESGSERTIVVDP